MNSAQLSELIHAHASKLAEKAVQPLLERIAELEARKLPEVIIGEPGRAGADGAPGRDGVAPSIEDVSAHFERRFSDLSLSWERQVRDMAEKAIDRMPRPKDGDPGRDGRDFGDVSIEYDGRRGLTIRYEQNGETVEQTKQMPVVIDAGFFAEGKAYEAGDGVTFGGSYWIAQKETETKPEIGNAAWRLAVKKGRDGKKP